MNHHKLCGSANNKDPRRLGCFSSNERASGSKAICYREGKHELLAAKNTLLRVFKFAERNVVILEKCSYFSFVYNSSKTNTENPHLCSVPSLKGMLRN